MKKELEKIANKYNLTLKERKSDSLDFLEVSVWNLEKMLKEAYELGRNSEK